MKSLINCAWCGNNTIKYYKIKPKHYLCVTCAQKHYDIVENKVNTQIANMLKGLDKRKNKIKQFTYELCTHTDINRSGYCFKNGAEMRELCTCNTCGKQFYAIPTIFNNNVHILEEIKK